MDSTKHLFTLLSLLSFSCGSLAQQLYLFNITKPLDGLSSTCISVLNQPLSCDPYLLGARSNKWLSDSVLSNVCTSSCTTAWANYLRRVNGACGTSRYNDGNGYLYLPMMDIEPVYEQYQLLCLKNPAGLFCNAVIRDILGINPDTQARSSGAPLPAPSAICDGCFISSLAQVLQMPMASATSYATAFSSLQASCKTTVPVTSPSKTSWTIPVSTIPSGPTCKGTQYTIKPGDTCQSIASLQGFSTTQLLAANHLTAYCRGFPTSGTICLPDQLHCTAYSPKSGDTCNSIAAKNRITFAQVISWNPELGELCGNMATIITKSMSVCISAPGGNWVNPYPITTTTTSTTETIFTEIPTPMSEIQGTVSPVPTITPNENYVVPFANGTRLDCQTYVTPPILLSAQNRTFTYACSDVASAYGVSLADLLFWNPGINQTGGFDGSCQLSGTAQYCIQPLVKIPNDTTKSCSLTALALPGSSCEGFAQRYNVTKAAVVAWNPSVKSDCTAYSPGMTYCTAVQHFKSSDTISTCSYWALANDSSPVICTTMTTKYKLDKSRFVAWNPSVLNDCSGAVNGYDYCVGTPTFHPGFPG